MSSRSSSVHDSKLPMATKTSNLSQATKTNHESKLTVGSKQTKTRESLPNARKKSATVQDDLLVKRRHLSVVDNNEQARRGSADAEKTNNVRKFSSKSDKNENIRHANRSNEKSRANSGKTKKKTDDHVEIPKENIPPPEASTEVVQVIRKEEATLVGVVSPETLPLPLGIINIDLDDGMFEYGAEIVAYLKERETLFVLPEDFLLQNSVTELMRSVLVDWLIQVHHYLKFSQEYLYLTITMVDSLLNARDVDPDKLQLVGATSLWIASKAEEYYPAELSKLIYLTKDSYKPHQVIQMEQIMLRILNFNVYFPDPMVFLLRFARAALRSNDTTFISTCQLLMDTSIVHVSYSSTLPSLRAAGSVLASLHLFSAVVVEGPDVECWTKTLVHYTGYSSGEVAPIAVAMLEEVARAKEEEDYKFNAVITKYKSNSQHNKLALQPHLEAEVIHKAVYNVSVSQKSVNGENPHKSANYVNEL